MERSFRKSMCARPTVRNGHVNPKIFSIITVLSAVVLFIVPFAFVLFAFTSPAVAQSTALISTVAPTRAPRPDDDLRRFVAGAWKFREGTCLSGQAPNWEGDIRQYERRMNFGPRRAVTIEEYLGGRRVTLARGRYSIYHSQLSITSLKNCDPVTTAPAAGCSPMPSEFSMLSIQGSELWILISENDAGLCPARDIFIAKFIRR